MRAVKRVPIRCAECLSDPNVRARLLAEVIVTPRGYDVWAVRKRRRVLPADPGRDLGPAYAPEGIHRRSAAPDEFVPCKRRHRGVPGGVTLNAPTIEAALHEAGAPPDLRRILIEPDQDVYLPLASESYAEYVRDLEREREPIDPDLI